MPSRYPAAPVLGVGAIVLHEGEVLLVRRGQPPLHGGWTLPGGRVELGERLEEALRREVEEETGWRIEVEALVDLYEYLERDSEGRILYHYVVADYRCRKLGGVLRAGSDVSEAKLVPVGAIDDYGLNEKAVEMIERVVDQGG